MATRVKPDPLIVIVGETASGKSALAMELADKFDGEIISADSWAVYKGFDIGTAKPTSEDRLRVRHHLIDVADPRVGFNAALFKRLAQKAIDDISMRDKLPLLVGGTGLYIDSIIYNYEFLPAPSAEQREVLNAMSLSELIELAKNQELNLDDVDQRNKRRVIRLIENDGQQPLKSPMRPNTLIMGVKIGRESLESKIHTRVDAMVEAGFTNEVKILGEKYGWENEAFKAPGYRAFKEYVNGQITLGQAKEMFVRNDLQLAKKQRTWFKRNNSIHWVENKIEAVDLVTTFLNK